jgi:hypothetical protein
MWTLTLPDNSEALQHIDKAFTYASGTAKFLITDAQKRSVKKIYDRYEYVRGVPEPALEGTGLGAPLLEALQESYDEVQSAGRLKELRNSLFLNASKCPSCGILPVDELDHYLPQASYPALAIYSSNIVPYCHVCNKRKLAATGVNPEERFIHAYYELLPNDVQFLFAKVWIEGKGLQCELEIRPIPELSAQVIRQMNFQMGRVKLVDRLIKEFFDYLTPMASYIQLDYQTGGQALVAANLEHSARNLHKQFGLNDWRQAVMQALASCVEFCDGGFYECLSLDRPAIV